MGRISWVSIGAALSIIIADWLLLDCDGWVLIDCWVLEDCWVLKDSWVLLDCWVEETTTSSSVSSSPSSCPSSCSSSCAAERAETRLLLLKPLALTALPAPFLLLVSFAPLARFAPLTTKIKGFKIDI